MSCRAASAIASVGSYPARTSSSARQCSTRSISVPVTTFSSAAVIVRPLFGNEAVPDLPTKGDSTGVAGEEERFLLRQPPFEAQCELAAHPDEDAAVNQHVLLLDAEPPVEVLERVRAALDPDGFVAVHASVLDARLADCELLHRERPERGELGEERMAVSPDAEDHRRQRIAEDVDAARPAALVRRQQN